MTFFKKKRVLLLNISFVLLWISFAAGYIAGTGDSGALCAPALALMCAAVLPAALAKK